MAYIPKTTLGRLSATTATDVYTVPSGKRYIVKLVSLVNTQTGEGEFVTVNVYVKRGSTTVRLWPVDRRIDPKERDHDPNVLALEAGDVLQLQASVAAVVDYVISGAEG